MAFEEISGGNGEYEEREFVSAKIGTQFEGTFRNLGPLFEGQYGQYRVVAFDTADGRKMAVRASKILLERIEAAGLSDGDGLKVVVESATAKKSGNTYANPRVFVDRKGGGQPAATQAAPKAPALPDEPPF